MEKLLSPLDLAKKEISDYKLFQLLYDLDKKQKNTYKLNSIYGSNSVDDLTKNKNKNCAIIGIGTGSYFNDLKKINDCKFVIFDKNIENIKSIVKIKNINSCDILFTDDITELVNNNYDDIFINESVLNIYKKEYQYLTNKFNYKKRTFTKRIKVALQARPDLFINKGGDTMVIQKNHDELKKLGLEVDITFDKSIPKEKYDLVHLYNFCTPEEIMPYAKNCISQDTPYVVTTLYEDGPNYFQKMVTYGLLFEEYFPNPSNYNFEKLVRFANNQHKSVPLRTYELNNLIAKHARALITSGDYESQTIARDFPDNQKIQVIPFGSNLRKSVSENFFYKKYGIKDYVLCVGRIEWRKNQAMLLKALEDSDLPILFIAGNMTYQPKYQEAVLSFNRKGPTYILSNLTEEELCSAYEGALVHVLPSWFELPGLVSIEAASLGTQVVATKNGTIYDYLGDSAYYCEPDNLSSIRDSIYAAIDKPKDKKYLIERAGQFTWENHAAKLVRLYESILTETAQKEV